MDTEKYKHTSKQIVQSWNQSIQIYLSILSAIEMISYQDLKAWTDNATKNVKKPDEAKRLKTNKDTAQVFTNIPHL